ncbi:2-iminoacetate synthase ThiH [Porphyromonas pogonae]|uniref:2-iminoacetate synthase ThiH n=1 Tax=Porphyromonas pogonae TaxID=867595 RepID=UPI002E767B21|nr:2-iminoacetate synthase ThiH [Porphyromonas pogonae]
MNTFYNELRKYDWDEVEHRIANCNAHDVEVALSHSRRDLNDFAALISPAAIPYLEPMAQEAHRLTVERFGYTMQMYIPLYLSNICTNACVYCGFNRHNKIHRRKLTVEEVDREVEAILRLGYKHLLLVSGEAEVATSADYYEEMVRRVRPHFSQISLEVQPLSTEEYRSLHDAGVGYVCVYQETYNEKAYPQYHPTGKKSNFRYRLETPDRIGRANIQKIGIGALLGLENWRTDSFFTALHLRYLEKTYWRTKYSISLPRLRPATGGWEPKDPIDDIGMVQLITAFRLLDPEVEISLSTREGSSFRDHVTPLGITSMSAGSKTEPGGYAEHHEDLEQFVINDARSPEEFARALRLHGYEAVWKDWDSWM